LSRRELNITEILNLNTIIQDYLNSPECNRLISCCPIIQIETYKQMLKIHPGQNAIITSGFSETDRVHEAKTLGVGAYIRKPYIMEKIGQAIKD
jgi:DNA-binding NarL/FixJ family response regulator